MTFTNFSTLQPIDNIWPCLQDDYVIIGPSWMTLILAALVNLLQALLTCAIIQWILALINQ